MTRIPVNVATEDELSEEVLTRLLDATGRYAIDTAYRRGGFGYLRRTIAGWNRAAKGVPFVVFTDLDQWLCPAELIRDWLPVPRSPNLLFRIAVREVESCLLADWFGISKYLGVKASPPSDADSIADPKAALIDLARRCRFTAIREGMAPRQNSTAKQGPDYNGCLRRFVRGIWDFRAASGHSESLARTMDRLTHFSPTWR